MLFQLIVFLTLFQLSLTQVVTPFSPLECRKPQSTICSIQNVVSKGNRMSPFPDLAGKHTLQIRSGKIVKFSKECCWFHQDVKKLHLGRLEMESLWIGPHLRQLNAEGNRIQELLVDSSHDSTVKYEMEILNLNNNQLKSAMELKVLILLKELRLDGNQLEFLEMETFAQMKQLKKLSLAKNRISEIVTSKLLELPALASLSLAFNNLSKLQVSEWKMLQLTEFELSHNQLVNLDTENFDQFVSLEKLAIADNQWHCYWLNKALNNFTRKYITLVDRDNECSEFPIDGICCSMTTATEDHSSYADLAERLQAFERSQTQVRNDLLKRIDRFNQTWVEQVAKIERFVAERERLAKGKDNSSTDEDKITLKDINELVTMVTKVEDRFSELKQLGSLHAQYKKQITMLWYQAVGLKNMFHAEMKNATTLQADMTHYMKLIDTNLN